MSSWHLEKERDTFHLVFGHKEASSAKVQHCLGSWALQFILRSAIYLSQPSFFFLTLVIKSGHTEVVKVRFII